jgi:hypothetical protein
MSQSLLALESFLALSEAMAGAAEAQEWEELVRVGEERGTLLAHLPADLDVQLPAAEQAQARLIIERCQQLDERTCLLVEERQKALRILLREPKPVT